MTTEIPHSFNTPTILAGSRRNEVPGGVRATRPGTSMYPYTQTAVKGIGKNWTRRLLESPQPADRGDLTDLLGTEQIARRGGGSVSPQCWIKSLVCGCYTQYVGGFGLRLASQDKADRYLLAYSPLAGLDYEVTA